MINTKLMIDGFQEKSEAFRTLKTSILNLHIAFGIQDYIYLKIIFQIFIVFPWGFGVLAAVKH